MVCGSIVKLVCTPGVIQNRIEFLCTVTELRETVQTAAAPPLTALIADGIQSVGCVNMTTPMCVYVYVLLSVGV